MTDEVTNVPLSGGGLKALLHELRQLVLHARRQVTQMADAVQVQTYWEVGRHIVEFEQEGADRAEYGKQLLPTLAGHLTAEFGRGFDVTNLRHMRAFYQAFPIRDALRRELSWTHYRTLLRLDTNPIRRWYMNESADQGWSTRALERQINTLYYERLLSSSDRKAVESEANAAASTLAKDPREFVRDPVMLEFLGLSDGGRLLEADLEKALLNNLQAFLLELGKGFAFVARQLRISSESKDFFVDLVFYNYLLKCFVLFDLKSDELTHQDIGQMDMYVRIVDDLKRGPSRRPGGPPDKRKESPLGKAVPDRKTARGVILRPSSMPDQPHADVDFMRDTSEEAMAVFYEIQRTRSVGQKLVDVFDLSESLF